MSSPRRPWFHPSPRSSGHDHPEDTDNDDDNSSKSTSVASPTTSVWMPPVLDDTTSYNSNHLIMLEQEDRDTSSPIMDEDDDESSGGNASLYSIAEDSREYALSEVSPSVENNNYNTSFRNPTSSSRRPVSPSPADVGIEIYIEKDEEDDWTKASDEQFRFYYQHRRRRRNGFILMSWMLCCLLLVAIIVITTVLVTSSNNDNKARASSAVTSQSNDTTTTNSAPEVTIQPSTLSPTFSPLVQTQQYVQSVLSTCPGQHTFQDESTDVGYIYKLLVDDVYQKYGGQNPYTLADAYIREKFALQMIYIRMGGYQWNNRQNWMITPDPCTWYGIECNDNDNNNNNSAAQSSSSPPQQQCTVTAIQLESNQLIGELPDELCCLPCAQKIDMSDNRIGGKILTCLAGMSTLRSIDFANNIFGTNVSSTTTMTASTSFQLITSSSP